MQADVRQIAAEAELGRREREARGEQREEIAAPGNSEARQTSEPTVETSSLSCMITDESAVRKESSMAKKKLRPTVSHLATSKFSRCGLRQYFEYRDLGVSRATSGRAAHVIRARPEKAPHGDWHYHDCKVQFTYVLKGWVKMQYEGRETDRDEGRVLLLPAGADQHREIAHSKDLEMIEVAAPQRFKTYDAKVR